MEKIPAVDILGGRCVQLVGGKLGTEKDYGNPVNVAKRWLGEGARILHVVDLDATLGRGENTATVLNIRKAVKVPIHFGGGIRTVEKARELLDRGVDRIMVGTMAVEDYMQETGKIDEVGEPRRIIAAIDSSKGMVLCKGWTEETRIKTTELVEKIEDKVWGFLYTNVDIEGQMKGIDIRAIEDVVKTTKKPVIISGGISSNRDIENIEKTGAWGVVLGKALYEGRIKPEF